MNKRIQEETIRFWEFCKAYVSTFYMYVWGGGSGVFLVGLFMHYPLLTGPLFFFMMLFWLGQQVSKKSWTDVRIANLLRYKELTQERFTPLELEVVNRYFGSRQRKSLILDGDVKNRWMLYVYLITALAVLLGLVGAYLVLMALAPSELIEPGEFA